MDTSNDNNPDLRNTSSSDPSAVNAQGINPVGVLPQQAAVKSAEVQQVNTSTEKQSEKRMGITSPLILLLLVLSFLGGLLLAGWYFQTQFQKLSSQKALTQTPATVKPKKLIIGTDATAPPMESQTKEGGLVGYDIDLGYRLVNEMGTQAEFENIPWDNIFQALLDKKIDMIISSVTITDERKQKYAFSDSYINAGQVIVSRKDHQITSTADLMGKKLSVQRGTTNETEALKLTTPGNVISYDDFTVATKALSEGKVDAMISDLTLAKGFISEYDNLKITSDPFTNEYYGIVMRKDDPDLQKKVNEALSVLRVKGILTDLKQKWLD